MYLLGLLFFCGGIMLWYWFLLLLLLLSTVCSYELKCLEASMQPKLPNTLALGMDYKVVVRHTDWVTNTTDLITEIHAANRVHVTVVSRTAGTTHFITGDLNLTYSESSCTALPSIAALPKLYVQPELAKLIGFNGSSMTDLISFLLDHKFTTFFLEDKKKVVGGVEAGVWIGCSVFGRNNFMQAEVVYTNNSFSSYSSTIKHPYILSIDLAAFYANKSIIAHDSVDIAELEQLPADKYLEAESPEGLYCSGLPEVKIPMLLPEKFEMSFDYTDINGKVIHDIQMFYNSKERIYSVRLNAEADKDVPFLGNATVPRGRTKIVIIHDFQYGLQYVMDAENYVCRSITMIDENFGDVQMLNESTKEIDLKKPAQLFWSAANSTFYYGGKRIMNNIPLDVYVTKVDNSSTTSTVVEMLYTSDNWTVGTAKAPFLYSIIQYHEGHQLGQEKTKTVIRVHSFKNASLSEIQQTSLSIYPCLKFVENSYLYVNVKNTTMEDLESLGIGRVQEGLREAIAHAAGVSVLRIANFFMKQLQENVIAFFVIGEATGTEVANTRNRSNETSAEFAINLLNTTLKERDITFIIDDGQRQTELKLSKSSLGSIPSTWGPLPTPTPSFAGYSGGSMFVLGFFMLSLGVTLGVGIVYFIWKRQRLSGLAYQVFE